VNIVLSQVSGICGVMVSVHVSIVVNRGSVGSKQILKYCWKWC